MGTNYYIRKDACPHCGRGEDEMHIGKSSGGWHFLLKVYPEMGLNTLEDWKPLLEKGPIYDEYNRPVTYNQMIHEITERQSGTWVPPANWWKENHAEPGKNGLASDIVDGHHCIGHGEGPWDYIVGEFC